MAESARTGSDLPAPYRSPWIRLGTDLVAVLAATLLKLREYWRRNREGDLPRPPFWPRRLASLFWPTALAVLLTVIAVGLAWPAASARFRSDLPDAVAGTDATDAGTDASVPSVPASADSPEIAVAGSVPAPPTTEQSPAPTTPEQRPEPLSNPLKSRFLDLDGDRQIASLEADPATSLLTLTLDARFGVLSARERDRRAELWRRRAEALGYDHLELRDASGGLLGRSALVGSGMILLDSVVPS